MPVSHECDFAEFDSVYPGITLLVIQIIAEKFTHILLNHHFINTIRKSRIFEILKGHLQGV